VEFEQYELSILAGTLRSYIQELPCPLIPAVVYSELVYTAQGKLNTKHVNTTIYTYIRAVNRLIVINRIQNKSLCLHNICGCTVYNYFVYI